MRIEDIDRNFALSDNVRRDDIVWYTVDDERIDLYGLCEPYDPARPFHRLPEAVAEATSEGVSYLNTYTAGVRARFVTDSPYLAIACELHRPMEIMPHMPVSGSQGFDVYRTVEGRERFINRMGPPATAGLTSFCALVNLPEAESTYTLNFPLYGTVKRLCIGLHRDAVLRPGTPYKNARPVVFYGSSITEGGCASRPGNSYQAMLSRRFDMDYINLGFSGNARGEEAIVSYMASLDMMAFVCDYDHNAPDLAHLERTLLPLYRAVRRAHPTIPFVFASSPGERMGEARRRHVRSVYELAVAEGDANVFFVDGRHMFDGDMDDSCTLEGCHPNDLGFYRMYEAFAEPLSTFL